MPYSTKVQIIFIVRENFSVVFILFVTSFDILYQVYTKTKWKFIVCIFYDRKEIVKKCIHIEVSLALYYSLVLCGRKIVFLVLVSNSCNLISNNSIIYL